jgi:hypothetical protein
VEEVDTEVAEAEVKVEEVAEEVAEEVKVAEAEVEVDDSGSVKFPYARRSL